MWKIGVGAGVAKSELQYRHAGDIVTIAQGDHVSCDQTEVFGEKGKAAQFLFEFVKEFVTWAVNPAAVDRSPLTGGDLPKLREAAKVVETDIVAGLRRPPKTLQPPAIIVGANRIPVVERISPALAGSAEVIRGHAGNDFRQEIVFV